MLSYSVVICTLNRPDDLTRCIESWLEQDVPPLEVVVVHGGTGEELETHLQALLGSTPVELRYLRMAPSLVRQRNAGVELARGDVVFFADDDAVYLQGYAAAVLRCVRGRQRTYGRRRPGDCRQPGSHFTTATRLANLFLLTRLNGNGTLQASGVAGVLYGAEGAGGGRSVLGPCDVLPA